MGVDLQENMIIIQIWFLRDGILMEWEMEKEKNMQIMIL